MRIRIRQGVVIEGVEQELRDYLKALLTTANPDWLTAKAFGRWTGNIPQFIFQFEERKNSITIPRGLLGHVLNDLGRTWDQVIDERVTPLADEPWPKGNIILRPNDQEPAITDLLNHDSGILSAPPGAGKTVVGLEAARRLGLKTLWLTHRKVLKDQTAQEAIDHLELPEEDIGFIQGKFWKIGKQLTIGMVPTLCQRDLADLERTFGLVIVDEGHHTPSRTFLQVVNQFASKHIYALTATAERRDQLETIMFNAIGPIIARIEWQELVEDEHLMSPKIRRRNTGWIPPEPGLEYHSLMKAMVHAESRNHLIVSDIESECQLGNVCIVLVGRTRHAEVLTSLLKERGISCEFVVGSVDTDQEVGTKRRRKRNKRTMPDEVREALIERFKTGRLQVLVTTYDLLREGFNYRPLNRLFLATPIKWKGSVAQAVGRVLRTAEGKEDAVVYDYVDWNIGMFARQAEVRFFSVYEQKGMQVEDS